MVIFTSDIPFSHINDCRYILTNRSAFHFHPGRNSPFHHWHLPVTCSANSTINRNNSQFLKWRKKNKKERNGDLQKNFDCHQLSLNAGIRVYKLNNIDISIYISVWVFRCNRLECTHAHTQLMLHWQQLRHNQCNCRCHRHRQSNCTWNSSQNISKINIRVQV